MKKLYLIAIVAVLIICAFASALPANAQDSGYTKVTKEFSVGNDVGYKISIGSIIRHVQDGVTEVRDKDNSLIMRSLDSEAETIVTPQGPQKATHVFDVPSGTLIKNNGNIVEFYKDNSLILTVISQDDDNKSPNSPPPTSGGWIEAAFDTGIKADNNSAYWNVPHMPANHSSTAVNYIFNDFQNWQSTEIIQPVLEWNYAGSQGWTGASWYVWGNLIKPNQDSARSTPAISTTQGHTISGTMVYNNNHYWTITTSDLNTGASTVLNYEHTNFGPDDFFGQIVNWALEGYYIGSNNDVADNITFTNISLRRNGNPVNYTLHSSYGSGYGFLTGLNVTWPPNQSSVTLSTANLQ